MIINWIALTATLLNSLTNWSLKGNFGVMSRLLLMAIMHFADRSAWVQTGSTLVKNDSVAWNKFLEGKRQKILEKKYRK